MDELAESIPAEEGNPSKMDEKNGRVVRMMALLKANVRRLQCGRKKGHKKEKVRGQNEVKAKWVNPEGDGDTHVREVPRVQEDIKAKGNTQGKIHLNIIQKAETALKQLRREVEDFSLLRLAYNRREDDGVGMVINRVPGRRFYYPPFTYGCYVAYDPEENFKYLYADW